jgi:uncharacterized membrane protein
MDDDEARLACGIFSIIYGLICLFIYAKTGIKIFESIWTYIIGVIVVIIINIYFDKKYPVEHDYEYFTDEFED